jgi:hypothetical protein
MAAKKRLKVEADVDRFTELVKGSHKGLYRKDRVKVSLQTDSWLEAVTWELRHDDWRTVARRYPGAIALSAIVLTCAIAMTIVAPYGGLLGLVCVAWWLRTLDQR